jgi:hypothetical protein
MAPVNSLPGAALPAYTTPAILSILQANDVAVGEGEGVGVGEGKVVGVTVADIVAVTAGAVGSEDSQAVSKMATATRTRGEVVGVAVRPREAPFGSEVLPAP